MASPPSHASQRRPRRMLAMQKAQMQVPQHQVNFTQQQTIVLWHSGTCFRIRASGNAGVHCQCTPHHVCRLPGMQALTSLCPHSTNGRHGSCTEAPVCVSSTPRHTCPGSAWAAAARQPWRVAACPAATNVSACNPHAIIFVAPHCSYMPRCTCCLGCMHRKLLALSLLRTFDGADCGCFAHH